MEFEETTLTSAQIKANVARYFEGLGRQPERKARSGRKRAAPSPLTRQRIGQGVRSGHARSALANGPISPLKRARLERSLTLKQVAERSGTSLNTCWLAEQLEPRRTTDLTWARLSSGLGLPLKAIKPSGAVTPPNGSK